MSKVEIDEMGDEVGHKDVSLTRALRGLKCSVLRMHNDVAKASYGKYHTDWTRLTTTFPLAVFAGKTCCQAKKVLAEEILHKFALPSSHP